MHGYMNDRSQKRTVTKTFKVKFKNVALDLFFLKVLPLLLFLNLIWEGLW